MAFKTISLDVEAYETLKRLKRPGESFSDVVKVRFGSTLSARELAARAAAVQIEPGTLDAIDREVERRRKSPARSAKL